MPGAHPKNPEAADDTDAPEGDTVDTGAGSGTTSVDDTNSPRTGTDGDRRDCRRRRHRWRWWGRRDCRRSQVNFGLQRCVPTKRQRALTRRTRTAWLSVTAALTA